MSPRILVADDSAVSRLTVTRRLRADGLDVIEHESVASAFTVDGAILDCALLDHDLGDGYGTEIAKRLRARAPALPIAFFTSTDDAAIRAELAVEGPVFAKPAELDAAIAWVESVLEPRS